MIDVRIHPEAPASLLALQAALGIRIDAKADEVWTTAACVVRRLAAVHAPCSRRELVAHAKMALVGILDTDVVLALHEVVHDLVASCDLVERIGLKTGEADAPVLLFLTPPRFSRTPRRIYLRGVVADDAPCLPELVTVEMVCAGSLRFVDTTEIEECAELLKKLGLSEEPVEAMALPADPRSVQELVDHCRTCLATGLTWNDAAGVRWLSPDTTLSYGRRWSSQPAETGLQIGRIPQFFGADAWVVVDHDVKPKRYVQLPVKGLSDERGCDAAWRVQLALDAASHQSARYDVREEDGVAQITVGFPVPNRERRKLLHLGATRPGLGRPYDFFLPRDVLPAAVATLESLAIIPSTETPK